MLHPINWGLYVLQLLCCTIRSPSAQLHDSVSTAITPTPAVVWRARDIDGNVFGVFANGTGFEAGELVERCYSKVVRASEVHDAHLRQFLYRPQVMDEEELLFPFGWCLLYNECTEHGGQPNIGWELEEREDKQGYLRQYITLRALRKIGGHEELCVQRLIESHRGALTHSAHDATKAFYDMTQNSSADGVSSLVSPGLAIAPPADIELRYSPLHGHGIFAKRRFEIDEVVEDSPKIITPRSYADFLVNYRFGRDNSSNEVALGLGSIYNHNDSPNVGVVEASSERIQTHKAIKTIEPGEEMFINYGPDWFPPANVSHPVDRFKETGVSPDRIWRSSDEDGRLGVFAGMTGFAAGVVVERCLCQEERPSSISHELMQWLYDPGHGGDEPVLFPFGWCLLYNEVTASGSSPNLEWIREVVQDEHGIDRIYISLRTLRAVSADEELCVSRRANGNSYQLRDMLGTSLKTIVAEKRLEKNMSTMLKGRLDAGSSRGRTMLQSGFIWPPNLQDVEIKLSASDRGVFARRTFKKDDVIEVAPNLLLFYRHLSPSLHWLCYEWSYSAEVCSIILGLGTFVNDNTKPNVQHSEIDDDGKSKAPAQRFSIAYCAAKDIEEGDELTISYSGETNDKDEL